MITQGSTMMANSSNMSEADPSASASDDYQHRPLPSFQNLTGGGSSWANDGMDKMANSPGAGMGSNNNSKQMDSGPGMAMSPMNPMMMNGGSEAMNQMSQMNQMNQMSQMQQQQHQSMMMHNNGQFMNFPGNDSSSGFMMNRPMYYMGPGGPGGQGMNGGMGYGPMQQQRVPPHMMGPGPRMNMLRGPIGGPMAGGPMGGGPMGGGPMGGPGGQPSAGGPMFPGAMAAQQQQRRPAPYPNPYMQNKRQQNPNMMQQQQPNAAMLQQQQQQQQQQANMMAYQQQQQHMMMMRPGFNGGPFPPHQGQQGPMMGYGQNMRMPTNNNNNMQFAMQQQQQFHPGMRPQGQFGPNGPPMGGMPPGMYNGNGMSPQQQMMLGGDPMANPSMGGVTDVNNVSPRNPSANTKTNIMAFQHSPVPGNPTPPLTPQGAGGGGGGGVGVPFASPASDHSGSVGSVGSVGMMAGGSPQDSRGSLPKVTSGEARLSFPVRDGIILSPFRLEHNLAVSNHVFHLKPQEYQILMYRPDLELQLKCYFMEDRMMNTNWPTTVHVSVNATPLGIERGGNGNGMVPVSAASGEAPARAAAHRPLYLKDVCIGGRNTIQITVTACCCSHLFVLQLVHRPTVRSVLQGLLRKRLLPMEHGVAKAKRIVADAEAQQQQQQQQQDQQQQQQLLSNRMSLRCPVSGVRMTLPARGHDCRHLQCFDLEAFLKSNGERQPAGWRCPVCTRSAALETLEVDQFTWSVLQTPRFSDVDDVVVDAAAAVAPVPGAIKSEPSEDCGPTSPESLRPPNLSLWEIPHSTRSPALYVPPDFSSIVSGQYPLEESGGPLSQLNEAVNNIDRAVKGEPGEAAFKMEPRTPCTPGMPATPHTPGHKAMGWSPPRSQAAPQPLPSMQQQQMPLPPMSDRFGGFGANNGGGPVNGCAGADEYSLEDFNFDASAIIGDTETSNLSLGDVDPDDLLSFLDPPPDLSTPPSTSSGTSSSSYADGGTGSSKCAPTGNCASSGASGPSPATENNGANGAGSTSDDLLNLIDNYEEQ